MQGACVRRPAQDGSDTQYTKTLVNCVALVPWFVLLSCYAWRPPQAGCLQVTHWRHERSRFEAYELITRVFSVAIIVSGLANLTNTWLGNICTALAVMAINRLVTLTNSGLVNLTNTWLSNICIGLSVVAINGLVTFTNGGTNIVTNSGYSRLAVSGEHYWLRPSVRRINLSFKPSLGHIIKIICALLP